MSEMRDGRPTPSWSDLVTRMLELGLGAATLTVDTAEKIVNDLVHRGQVSKEESAGLVDRLLALGHEQRRMVGDMISKATEQATSRLDLARRSEIDELKRRIDALERAVHGQPPVEELARPVQEGELGDTI